MAPTQSRSSGLFSGLVLISVGILLLLHFNGHLQLGKFFIRWWPLLIVFWGAVKLYERTAGRRFGGSGGGITGGEIVLVAGMLALLGAVVAADYTKEKIGGMAMEETGDNHEFDLEVAPVPVPPNAHINVRLGRGDLSIHGSDNAQIRVSAKTNVRSWSDREAERMSKPVGLEIVKNGDAYEVRPKGYDLSDGRISLDLDLAVPQKSTISTKSEKGDITVSNLGADLSVALQNGDVDIRDITGDISVETHKGDVKVTSSKGDVKVSGKGGEIDVIGSTGSLTVDGDFYGPVRAERVAKGVRMVSAKTDLTLSALTGHMEIGSGNFDIVDAPGNLMLRTRDNSINVENLSGKATIDNRNAEVNVRLTTIPKDDIQVTNSSAAISLTLPGASSFEVLADCHNCDIESEFSGLSPTKSQAGDSHLEGKYGSGRGPKITLKTSYGSISLRRTSMVIPSKPPSVPAPPVPPSTEQ